MSKYKYIFFDVAHTLLYKPQLFKRILECLEKYGYQIEYSLLAKRHKILSEVIKFPEKTSAEFYEYFNAELLMSLGVLPDRDIVHSVFEACKCLPWEAYEDAHVLKKIGKPIGIISNWDSALGLILEDKIEVPFFKVVASEVIGFSKPDPDIYLKAIEGLNCAPEDILYVGDSIKLDIQPALDLGFTAVLIDRDDVFPHFNGEKIRSLEWLSSYIDFSEPSED